MGSIVAVVVTHNSSGVLGGLLGSLERGFEGVPGYELVIVDNASGDGTTALARRLAPDATVIENADNGGYAYGINVGLRAAPAADHYLVLNPDVVLRPGSVRTLLRAMAAHPRAGIVVPRTLDADGDVYPTLRREPTIARAVADALFGGRRTRRWPAISETITERSAYDEPSRVDWASGSAMLISARCLIEVGPWDESFFLYSEETDFALRARGAGFELWYEPDAEVVHLLGDLGRDPSLWALAVVNRVRLYARRHRRPLAIAFWMVALATEASRAAVQRDPTRIAAVRALLHLDRRDRRPLGNAAGDDRVAAPLGAPDVR